MQQTKEHIKASMLKNAARAWGFGATEAESHFDPVVSLLFTACAAELAKISGEIQASRARILSRLVQLLAPDTYTGALPAHGVATALPVENREELYEDTQFYLRIRSSSTHEKEEGVSKDIFFTPTHRFQLNKAAIQYMAVGNRLYKTSHSGKEVMAINHNNALPESTLWLGMDEPGVSLHHSRFYFDCRNREHKNLFYHQLPKARWFHEDAGITALPGYGTKDICAETFDAAGVLNNESRICLNVKKQINGLYKPCFVTLSDVNGVTGKKGCCGIPPILLQVFNHAEETAFLTQTPLRWLAIQFPETISNNLLQEVVCFHNAFPVMNRRLHAVHYRLKEIINVIALTTEDLFFDLEEVCDEEGNKLAERTEGGAEKEALTLLLRRGGVERFDERNAAQITEHLYYLLQEESAAFSALGNDFMNNEIRTLQQTINKLEQKTGSHPISADSIPHLIIRTHGKQGMQKNLSIKYWSTNGPEANNLQAGTLLLLYKGALLNNNQAVLVTATKGGRKKLDAAESVLAYKSALLSKNRIVTEEDIAAFCYHQLAQQVASVAVEKGVMAHPDEQKGFVKTIDVNIELSAKAYSHLSERNELDFWQQHLKLLLEQQSGLLMPYRVIIGKAA